MNIVLNSNRLTSFNFDNGYKREGDDEMYTEENVQKREALKHYNCIEKRIREFWGILDMAKNDTGELLQEHYLTLHQKIQRVRKNQRSSLDAHV